MVTNLPSMGTVNERALCDGRRSTTEVLPTAAE
ncbi:hypothetical protein MKAN_20235 [Mycobacterium kansasii ATCC 12478]|uniref:Uncharacterized protein n=1 Tax=Mycobacterium kansasii ATCC 12478 TaxID=557599 RepID=U5WZH3_MYCKA|nr:hypothetical protein MKAN_20235 [Mycobacterium kansasii ATCC 12478]